MRPHLRAMVRRYRGAMVLRWPTVRRGLASYWTAGIAWAVMTGTHGRWLWRSCHPKDGHAGDVLSAYGAGLVVLGILIASRPYLRTGIVELALQQAAPGAAFLIERTELLFLEGEERQKAYDNFRQKLVRDGKEAIWNILAEREIAVFVIVLGTLLNGWGTPLARRWGLLV